MRFFAPLLLAALPTAAALLVPQSSYQVARSSTSPGRRELLGQVAAAALAVGGGARAALANSDSTMSSISTQTPLVEGADQFIQLPSGVKFKEIRAGSGGTVRLGDTVAVQYTGRLLNLNGKKFASSLDTAADNGGLPEPYTFVVGDRTAIPGLEGVRFDRGPGCQFSTHSNHHPHCTARGGPWIARTPTAIPIA